MSGRFQVALVLVAVVFAICVPAVQAQSAGGSMSVSVTVVRSCSVSAPGAAAPSAAASLGARDAGVLGDASVRVSCGRSPSSTPLMAGAGVVPVAGAPAAARVATRPGTGSLVVSVDF